MFLSQNNKQDDKQSGFRSGHSTETALLSVTEALRNAKADSKSSVLILLDLSAAFDTVSHHILLSTLSSLDITGIPLRWFESYLTGRSFGVAWGGEVSKAHQLVTGFPQGSVLGPLLFSTYTTSLAPIIQAHGFSYHFYADNTQLPLRIYIPSRSPAYFKSLLRIYIPSKSPAYFHSLSRIYTPSRSPSYFHSL